LNESAVWAPSDVCEVRRYFHGPSILRFQATVELCTSHPIRMSRRVLYISLALSHNGICDGGDEFPWGSCNAHPTTPSSADLTPVLSDDRCHLRCRSILSL